MEQILYNAPQEVIIATRDRFLLGGKPRTAGDVPPAMLAPNGCLLGRDGVNKTNEYLSWSLISDNVRGVAGSRSRLVIDNATPLIDNATLHSRLPKYAASGFGRNRQHTLQHSPLCHRVGLEILRNRGRGSGDLDVSQPHTALSQIPSTFMVPTRDGQAHARARQAGDYLRASSEVYYGTDPRSGQPEGGCGIPMTAGSSYRGSDTTRPKSMTSMADLHSVEERLSEGQQTRWDVMRDIVRKQLRQESAYSMFMTVTKKSLRAARLF